MENNQEKPLDEAENPFVTYILDTDIRDLINAHGTMILRLTTALCAISVASSLVSIKNELSSVNSPVPIESYDFQGK